MKPCKHLDYDEAHYPKCKLKRIDDFEIPIFYWDRFEGGFITQKELNEYPNTAIKVQFCKLRGRINGIFQCYQEGKMYCYEPDENKKEEKG